MGFRQCAFDYVRRLQDIHAQKPYELIEPVSELAHYDNFFTLARLLLGDKHIDIRTTLLGLHGRGLVRVELINCRIMMHI